MNKVHPELTWLTGSHWVKFDGDTVIRGHRPADAIHVISGVEQVDITRLHVAGDIEVWHKKGRTNSAFLGKYVYEPAAFLVVKRINRILSGYTGYETLRIVRSGKRHKDVLNRIKFDIQSEQKGS